MALEEESKQKSTGLAYVLLLFLGGFGAHQLYIGNAKKAAIFIGLSLGSMACLGFGFLGFAKIIADELPAMTALSEKASLGDSKAEEKLRNDIMVLLEGRQSELITSVIFISANVLLSLIFLGFWIYDLATLHQQVRDQNAPPPQAPPSLRAV